MSDFSKKLVIRIRFFNPALQSVEIRQQIANFVLAMIRKLNTIGEPWWQWSDEELFSRFEVIMYVGDMVTEATLREFWGLAALEARKDEEAQKFFKELEADDMMSFAT